MIVRAKRAFVLFVLCLVAPNAAEAQIGRGWLEKLSGPGPFRGFPVLEFRPLCLAKTASAKDRATGQDAIDGQPKLKPFILPLGGKSADDTIGWATLVGCHFLPGDTPRIEIGFQFSPLHSGANALDYSHLEAVGPLPDTGVDLRTYMFTFDIRINRILDVGAAVGWGTFSSQGDIFETFSRPIGQPMRLTTRPLAVLWNSKKAEILLIQFDGTRFAGGFTDADFGANPGSYDEPGEMLWAWSIKADLTALFWK